MIPIVGGAASAFAMVPSIVAKSSSMARSHSVLESPVNLFSKPADPGFYVGGFGGVAPIVLGSNEVRRGGGIFWGYGKDQPALRLWHFPGEFVVETGLDDTFGNGGLGTARNDRLGFYLLPMARYRGRSRHGHSLFFDAGLGLYFSDPTTDLPSFVSTMPTLDVGLSTRGPIHEWLLGLRWRHSSNAGTKGTNDGQNFYQLFVSWRY